jgi:F0F1-type ATP synthase alpha subunit
MDLNNAFIQSSKSTTRAHNMMDNGSLCTMNFSVEYPGGIPDYLTSQNYNNTRKRNLIVFDDLVTEAKCDQRIADLFTKSVTTETYLLSISPKTYSLKEKPAGISL